MSTIGEHSKFLITSTGQGTGLGFSTIAIGGTGAVTGVTGSMPQVTASRSSAGVYALTFPKGKKGAIFASALGVDVNVTLGAVDYTAGTATLRTYDEEGDLADAATGSAVNLLFVLDARGQ